MARRYFAVTFRALHESTETVHFSVEIIPSRSEKDAERMYLNNFKAVLTEKDGWSLWTVVATRIPTAWVNQVEREANWFDQTGAHHLYAIAVCAANQTGDKTAVHAGSVMAYTEAEAIDELREYIKERFPAADGWEAATDLCEYYIPRRRPLSAISYVPKNVTIH